MLGVFPSSTSFSKTFSLFPDVHLEVIFRLYFVKLEICKMFTFFWMIRHIINVTPLQALHFSHSGWPVMCYCQIK